jgi:hypothetical protein
MAAPFPRKNIVILAMCELPVLAGATIRYALAMQDPPSASPRLLPWLVTTCVLAALSVSVHQVVLVLGRQRDPGATDEASRRALSIALTVLGAAALLCVAGPRVFELVLGA